MGFLSGREAGLILVSAEGCWGGCFAAKVMKSNWQVDAFPEPHPVLLLVLRPLTINQQPHNHEVCGVVLVPTT